MRADAIMWGWALLGLSAANGLVIESGAADALCPDLATTRAAVLARVGAVQHPEDKPHRLRYTVGHTGGQPRRDFVRVELFDPDGQLQLSRELPVPEGDCQSAAQGIALVVERYFRALETGPTTAAATEATSPEAAVAPPPKAAARRDPPVAIQPDTNATAPQPTDEIVTRQRRLWIGPWVGWGSGATALLGLQVVVQPVTWLDLALLPGWASRERVQRFPGAAVRAWSLPLRWAALFRHQLSRTALQLGPEVLVLLESARTEGFEPPRTGTRWAIGLGARAGVEQRLSSAWALTLQGGFDWVASTLVQPFQVSGEEVLQPADVQAFVTVGVMMGAF